MRKIILALAVCLCGILGFTSRTQAASGVKIDGHFDDWQSQPVEKWTTDNFTYHDVGLTSDDQNVYLYVSMGPGNPGNYKTMQPSGYQITVNGKTYDLTLHLYDKLWSLKPGEGGWFDADLWNRSAGHDSNLSHAGYILRDKESDGRGNDVMEVAIPLSTFGNDVNQSTIIKLRNDNLGGSSEITAAGSSTAPYGLVLIAVLLVATSGYVIYRKRRQQSQPAGRLVLNEE